MLLLVVQQHLMIDKLRFEVSKAHFMVMYSKRVDSNKGVEKWIQNTYDKGYEIIILNQLPCRQLICPLFGHI